MWIYLQYLEFVNAEDALSTKTASEFSARPVSKLSVQNKGGRVSGLTLSPGMVDYTQPPRRVGHTCVSPSGADHGHQRGRSPSSEDISLRPRWIVLPSAHGLLQKD